MPTLLAVQDEADQPERLLRTPKSTDKSLSLSSSTLSSMTPPLPLNRPTRDDRSAPRALSPLRCPTTCRRPRNPALRNPLPILSPPTRITSTASRLSPPSAPTSYALPPRRTRSSGSPRSNASSLARTSLSNRNHPLPPPPPHRPFSALPSLRRQQLKRAVLRQRFAEARRMPSRPTILEGTTLGSGA